MQRKRLIYVVLCLLLTLGAWQALAQEETETPSPPSPIIPSATPLPLATNTATLTPLPTDTASATMTATETATATNSPTSTLTATQTTLPATITITQTEMATATTSAEAETTDEASFGILEDGINLQAVQQSAITSQSSQAQDLEFVYDFDGTPLGTDETYATVTISSTTDRLDVTSGVFNCFPSSFGLGDSACVRYEQGSNPSGTIELNIMVNIALGDNPDLVYRVTRAALGIGTSPNPGPSRNGTTIRTFYDANDTILYQRTCTWIPSNNQCTNTQFGNYPYTALPIDGVRRMTQSITTTINASYYQSYVSMFDNIRIETDQVTDLNPIICPSGNIAQPQNGAQTNNGDSCPNPTPAPSCFVDPIGNRSFRINTDLEEQSRILIIGDNGVLFDGEGIVTTKYDFPDQWNVVPGGNPDDWIAGITRTRMTATSWYQNPSDNSVWIGIQLENLTDSSVTPINGYMVQRLSSNDPDALVLSCSETSLPGYAGPPPTPTIGPSPTPNPLYWYVICTLRPNEQPPIEVNVRNSPSSQGQIIQILGSGERVQRLSLNPNDEVNVGNGIIYVQVVNEWTNDPNTEAWVARSDSLGALLEPQRAQNCPPLEPTPTIAPPTSTPDPSIPLVNPGQFANQSTNGRNVVFDSVFPEDLATVGNLGFHAPPDIIDYQYNSRGLILDIMPRSEERNVDTDFSYVPNEITIYSPVSGALVPCDDVITLIINDEPYTFTYNQGAITVTDVRREIILSHVNPNPEFVQCDWNAVSAGDPIGTLDVDTDGDGPDRAPLLEHVAFQLRVINADGQTFIPNPDELLGVITAGGRCIYDDWVNREPPIAYDSLPANDPLLNERIQACPESN